MQAHQSCNQQPRLSNISNILAISAGKGGVGKSMLTWNLAKAWQKQGVKVGVLDADIYGPSQAYLHAICTDANDNKAVIINGVAVVSMGYLLNDNTAVAWRGPMLSKVLQQFLYNIIWPKLDVLLIDMPPGTGDVVLTLAQKIPLTATVMVTTPQDIALIDVQRAAQLFVKLNVPILGVVENMSTYKCSNCQVTHQLFGEGGADKLAANLNVECLAKLPFMQEYAADSKYLDNVIPDFLQLAIAIQQKLKSLPLDTRLPGNISLNVNPTSLPE